MEVGKLIRLAAKMSPSKTGFYRFNIATGVNESREYDLRLP